jgi:hypothetical protein
VKKHLSILVTLAALAGAPALAPAQDAVIGRPPEPAAVSTGSGIDRLRGDADDARRRESDLAAQVADQERTNAMLRDQIRRAGSDPSGVARDLADASDQATTLRKKVADQRQRRDAAEDKLNAARDRAMESFEQTDAVKAARKAYEDAAAELDRLSQPIFDQLVQTQAYQDQQAIVDAAAQTGEAIQVFNSPDPRPQMEADAAFDMAMSGLRALEDAAVAADPTTTEARKAVKVAQDTLDGLRAENEKKIERDPAVDAARFALDLEQKLLDDASAQLATAEKRLSALRQANNPQGGANDLANQLRDGETRLRDLNDRLDQARVARRDAEDRLSAAEDAVARGPSGTAEPGPETTPPPVYEPAPTYSGADYSGGGYYYPPTYYSPAYGYGYYYPRYAPYYSYDYCPPYYYGSGLFLGFSYVSRPWYSHSHYYHHPYYYGRSYYHSPYYGYGYGRDYNRYHDRGYHYGGSNTYASYGGRYSGYGVGPRPLPRDSRYTTSGLRYDYARFSRPEATRDRDVRSSIDAARRATADAERDYRYRSGVTTYDYPGSSRYRSADTSSLRTRSYEDDLRARRGTSSVDSGRSTRSEPSAGSPRVVDRSDVPDSAARRSRAADDAARARSDPRPRFDDSAARRSTRATDTPSRSAGADVPRSRVTDSPSRSVDVPRSRSIEPSPSRSVDVPRSRGSDAPSRSVDPAPSRGAAPAPSRSEPPARSSPPVRGRSADDSAGRRARATEDAGRARSGTRSGGADLGFRGTSRSERPSSPPPSFGSGRSSSRGGGSPPPSLDSGRGSSRGGSSPAPSSIDRGSSRGADSSSRGSSSAGSSSRGGGASGGGGGGHRGR